jgi:hypothetical protein
MAKCNICDAEAEYQIKDTTNFYCKECAIDFFNDLNLLVKVEKEVKKLKDFIESKIV